MVPSGIAPVLPDVLADRPRVTPQGVDPGDIESSRLALRSIGFVLDGRQPLPWDYFRVARYSGVVAKVSEIATSLS